MRASELPSRRGRAATSREGLGESGGAPGPKEGDRSSSGTARLHEEEDRSRRETTRSHEGTGPSGAGTEVGIGSQSDGAVSGPWGRTRGEGIAEGGHGVTQPHRGRVADHRQCQVRGGVGHWGLTGGGTSKREKDRERERTKRLERKIGKNI